jgi:hypothetical protein
MHVNPEIHVNGIYNVSSYFRENTGPPLIKANDNFCIGKYSLFATSMARHINILCEKNIMIFNGKAGGTQSNHRALNG